MIQLENRIRQLLDEILASDDCYLVDLRMRPNKVEVYADRDPHISIDDCARISRQLVKQLDDEMEFSKQYALEVSSPGMDRPLKVMRQYRKSIGRKVEVEMHSGARRTGVLRYADDDKIILEEKMKATAPPQLTQSEIPFTQIKSTQVAFNF